MYQVKEAFYTLQGEGAQAGRASVFCRFSGCNLWSGREQDRATAKCTFCDTDFIGIDGNGGGKFATTDALANHITSLWPSDAGHAVPYVVFTGGEPLLQLDAPLIATLHSLGFEVAVETNGTLPPPAGIDWLCVSPKGKNPLVVHQGDELKLVFPQVEAPPEAFAQMNFRHFYLQPMDLSPVHDGTDTVARTTAYCLAHPQWRLSLQTHKIAGFD
ncbi:MULTISPECIES: 7-carboxy-7-deazaguanine synthase [unclassified Halomonas]|uniref:7-carboxy-7-deazaguanine synthase n=1 Tax=unclassified Halomonas TaxID=2609666 RepID=UPI0006DB8105|nr:MULTISPECIES: 7-carboxy-7-deazaguanine synthase [unclassified Halomonas]KPQ22053.1 MAG: queuosine biosynthesis radical SAM protein QueE [Halomonas sp. HL-93]SBR48542.1 7-carboxy-7-deazaguanine synthase, Cx14CxxC type [Halomonas sp. HL-93]SNY96235.1 7-carboxy-7-deazaguanine synthase, Cx14CxxC type [Halomonas sp. hl-4]